MASIFNHAFDQPIDVRSGGDNAASWQAVQIRVGSGGSICLSLAEAQQLIVELQRELASAEAAARGVAA